MVEYDPFIKSQLLIKLTFDERVVLHQHTATPRECWSTLFACGVVQIRTIPHANRVLRNYPGQDRAFHPGDWDNFV